MAVITITVAGAAVTFSSFLEAAVTVATSNPINCSMLSFFNSAARVPVGSSPWPPVALKITTASPMAQQLWNAFFMGETSCRGFE